MGFTGQRVLALKTRLSTCLELFVLNHLGPQCELQSCSHVCSSSTRTPKTGNTMAQNPLQGLVLRILLGFRYTISLELVIKHVRNAQARVRNNPDSLGTVQVGVPGKVSPIPEGQKWLREESDSCTSSRMLYVYRNILNCINPKP